MLPRAACRCRNDRRGAVLVLAAFLMVVMFAMVAFAVDIGYLALVKTELQRQADAAALAGVATLIDVNGDQDQTTAYQTAAQFASLNPSSGTKLTEMAPQDMVIGSYDPVGKQVVPNTSNPDSIQVWARRQTAQGTRVRLFFAPALGILDQDLSATAIAQLNTPSGASGLPIALRTPDFGPVDPEIVEVNPGKDGPSAPANGKSFEVGEQVTVFIFGKGKKSPIHLTLDVDSPGPGASEADVKKVLRGEGDPVPLHTGDEFLVFNEGSGSGGFGSALEKRLGTPFLDPMRDVVVPVVDVIPGESRVYANNGLKWELEGNVRVVDFVGVHLDDVIETEVPDPSNPGNTIGIRLLVGTVTHQIVPPGDGGSQAPSGVGGNTVSSAQLVY